MILKFIDDNWNCYSVCDTDMYTLNHENGSTSRFHCGKPFSLGDYHGKYVRVRQGQLTLESLLIHWKPFHKRQGQLFS